MARKEPVVPIFKDVKRKEAEKEEGCHLEGQEAYAEEHEIGDAFTPVIRFMLPHQKDRKGQERTKDPEPVGGEFEIDVIDGDGWLAP
jgi:hypothetical protein